MIRRMKRKAVCTGWTVAILPLICLLAYLSPGCTGGKGGSHESDTANSFNSRNVNLYKEVPLIQIQGNRIQRTPPKGDPYWEVRNFNPQTDTHAGLYDSDKDGTPDKPINDFVSLANAANNMLDIDLAACAVKSGANKKHEGYLMDEVWADTWKPDPVTGVYRYQYPDTMPATADASGTKGTQFIQVILPLKIERASLFDEQQQDADQVDYLNGDSIVIEDEEGNHVPCTVLVDGADVHGSKKVYAEDPELPELKGVKLDGGSNASVIVFIAQAAPGVLGDIPHETPFSLWAAGKKEIRIHLKQAMATNGDEVNFDSRWVIQVDGVDPADVPLPQVVAVEATDPVLDAAGNVVVDDTDPGGKEYPLVHRGTSFILRFDKPVIPETVGQSIVFAGAPFNGNTQPIPTSLVLNPPPPDKNICEDSGQYHDPIAPNVALYSALIYPDGSKPNQRGILPFRVHPLHQNNLCAYVVNPVIDLPGSTDLGTPPFHDPLVTEFTLMRVTLKVYIHDGNTLTGKVVELPLSAPQIAVNMGVCGYFRETMDTGFAATFTVNSGGHYVNAPVCPQALYYAMGPGGLGVVDLDGNGFTTNDPDFSKVALVTSEAFYYRYGNAGMGLGNNYSYGSRAVQNAPPYVGLGSNTPMPGVNEGSSGIDTVVRDSKGSATLFPPPGFKFANITDVEVGDFLDTLFFDQGNPWSHKSFHISAVNQAAQGNYMNNLIATPPTPNPPPLTIPIGMTPTHVILDEFNLSEEGAFVIMGKEVFTVDMNTLTMGMSVATHTGFIHLKPAELAGSAVDEPFPPNPTIWGSAFVDFMNTGPVADSSTIGLGMIYGSRQQIGNFLFVADRANNVVQVLNSNTMDVITTLSGLNMPDGVSVSPDLRRLYVSNSGGQSVSVFNANPRDQDFLYPVAEVWVGSQPKGICCQPDGEDVFVCNYGSSTISIINPKTNTVRKTLSSLLKKPWDCVMGPRQTTFGFQTGVFHGYIANYGGNNVLVYESGPDGFGGIGYDDILDPVPEKSSTGNQWLPIQEPRGICWDPAYYQQNVLSGGCYVAHRAGSHAMVSRIQFTAQQGPNGPIFLIPNSGSIGGTPGFGKRIFSITAQWGGAESPLSGNVAVDVALQDYNRNAWLNENWIGNFYVTSVADLGQNPLTELPANNKHPIRILFGAIAVTYSPDRMFVSYQHTPVIDVIDPTSSQVIKTITGLPMGARVLKTYFKN